jgi:hypothetical protein
MRPAAQEIRVASSTPKFAGACEQLAGASPEACGCLRAVESDTTMASYGKLCGWNVSECGWNACEQSSLRVVCICLPAAHPPSLIVLWQALRVELRVVSMRQHTSAYASIRPHTFAYVSIRALRVELRVECLPAAQGVRAHGKQGRRVARLSRRSGGF